MTQIKTALLIEINLPGLFESKWLPILQKVGGIRGILPATILAFLESNLQVLYHLFFLSIVVFIIN